MENLTTQSALLEAPPAKPPILVAVLEPGQNARLARIENALESLQSIVGGYIECFPVVRGDDDLKGICNEEGLLHGLPPSRFNPATDAWIVGTFLVAGDRWGDDGREFCSLSPLQVAHLSCLYGRIENLDLLQED